MIENRPTREGFELGFHLARFADAAPQIAERCFTCAFRQGTDANGSPVTTMDAQKCVFEGVPFYCHESEGGSRLCGGYVILRAAAEGTFKVAWPFSDELLAPPVPDQTTPIAQKNEQNRR